MADDLPQPPPAFPEEAWKAVIEHVRNSGALVIGAFRKASETPGLSRGEQKLLRRTIDKVEQGTLGLESTLKVLRERARELTALDARAGAVDQELQKASKR